MKNWGGLSNVCGRDAKQAIEFAWPKLDILPPNEYVNICNKHQNRTKQYACLRASGDQEKLNRNSTGQKNTKEVWLLSQSTGNT